MLAQSLKTSKTWFLKTGITKGLDKPNFALGYVYKFSTDGRMAKEILKKALRERLKIKTHPKYDIQNKDFVRFIICISQNRTAVGQ